MALLIWIILVATATTSAYKHPYSSYRHQHQDQKNEAQYLRVYDGSLVQKTDKFSDSQERPEDTQNIQEYQADFNVWNPRRPIKKSVPFGYFKKSFGDEVMVSPQLNDVHLLNRRPSYDIANSFHNSYPSKVNKKGAAVFDGELFSYVRKSKGQNMFIPQVTEECEALGLCENSPDYPHEYVEALLAKLPQAKLMFRLDKETPEEPLQKHPESNQTILLCKPRVRMMYPDKVKTKTGKWVFAINGKTKVQGFYGTLCLNEGKECNNLVYYPWGYNATCEQKHMDQPVWALDHNGEMISVTTAVPSCCNCELKKIKTPTN